MTLVNRFVRPSLSYAAAVIVAGLVLLAPAILLARAPSEGFVQVLTGMIEGFLVVSAYVVLFITAPAFAFTWLAHLLRWPRPLSDMVFGGCAGVIAIGALSDYSAIVQRDALPAVALIAAAGAIAGLLYGRLAGRPRA